MIRIPGSPVTSKETSPSLAAIVAAVDGELPDFRAQTSPEGMLTIAFTDIEGSTAMLERMGEERWFKLMMDHNTMVQECVTSHCGEVVKSQGDGFMVVFSSSSAALAWAVDLQWILAKHNSAPAEEPLRVRIGLHTGNIFQADHDFFGKAVVLAARITGHARGGQVLVSGACRDYTLRSGRWRYGPQRDLKLKGLAGPERVYRLDWTKC
jgi:class 3 adenylate cyclase